MTAARYLPDTAAIRADLEFMTRRWGELVSPCKFELRSLFRGTAPHWEQFTISRLQEAADWAAKENGEDRNVYAVRNPIRMDFRGSASDEAIVAAFFCWADFDDPEAAENVRRFDGPRWTASIMTGRIPTTRVHLYWELEKPVGNMVAWEGLQKNIASHFKSDSTVTNPSRVMRVGGTVCYPDPQKVERGYVIEASTLRLKYDDPRPPIAFERMTRVFGAGPAQPEQGFKIDTGTGDHKTAESYADILRRARTDGEKHSGVRDLAASLAGQGVSRAMAEAIISQACPVWDDNVEILITSAYEKFYREKETYADPEDIDFDAKPEEPQAASASDLEWYDDIKPVLTDGYLVKGVLASGTMSVVYGPSNSGKTFFALDLAFHIATATPWQQCRVKAAAVLYLAAEGGRGVANRIAALRAETGCCDVPLALRRAGLDLLKSNADLQHIVTLVREVLAKWPGMPILIVIDTLSRIMAGGDENNAADMTALIRNIDAIRSHTGAHIMLVHHTGKDAAKGARGHSSLRAATDTEIEVMNEDGARAAQVQKQRDYPGNETFAFGLKTVSLGFDEDGDEVTSCVVEWQNVDDFREKRDLTKGLGGNQKLIAETFDQMVSEGLGRPNPGGVGMPETGQFWTVDRTELRRISMGKMVAADPRSSFNKALVALTVDRGLFVTGENLVWRIDRRIS